jgi:predicted nucleic acid-binding protein
LSTPVVLDASAGVEILLRTPTGRRLLAKLPKDRKEWVPEIYYAEVAGVLRRQNLHWKFNPTRIQIALDRLLSAPLIRVQLRPLLSEAWTWRHNLTIADALYIVLARHLDASLVTTDLNLANTPQLPVKTIVP